MSESDRQEISALLKLDSQLEWYMEQGYGQSEEWESVRVLRRSVRDAIRFLATVPVGEQ